MEEPGHPLVNPVVVASGCAEHANVYAIYAVDSRQASSRQVECASGPGLEGCRVWTQVDVGM